jgi:cysteine-rich repeat protein
LVIVARAHVLVVLATVAGCLHTNTVDCADGSECPADKVCLNGGGCAFPGQLTACEGVADGAACTFAGGVGTCMNGVCIGALCGNGELDPGETCDGTIGVDPSLGETCSPDCKTIYRCGNGVVDPGEQCDDGNANAADGCDTCKLTTWNVSVPIGAGIAATSIRLTRPGGVAVDHAGNLYLSDTGAHRVLRVDRVSGAITLVAGTSVAGYSGDGGDATAAQLNAPNGLALDGIGNLFITDTNNNAIRRVDGSTGVITTVAGDGSVGYSGDNGLATSAKLSLAVTAASVAGFSTGGVAVDGLGNLYIADVNNSVIRRVDAATSIITTVAGAGVAGVTLRYANGVAVDVLGNLYIADTYNDRVLRVDTSHVTSTVWRGTSSALQHPQAVTVDGAGTVYIAVIVGLNAIVEVGGTGTTIGSNDPSFAGDGGPANSPSVRLSVPAAVAVDGNGNLYIADSFNDRIRRVDAGTQIIDTFVGGQQGLLDGAATTVPLNPTQGIGPFTGTQGVAVDSAGNVYITDTARVVRVDALTGVMTTVAGTGSQFLGSIVDGALATDTRLLGPMDLAFDAAGNLFILDANTLNLGQGRILRVDAVTKLVSTVAPLVPWSAPGGLAFDTAGDLYVADSGNDVVRRVDAGTGAVTIIAGTGTAGYTGDNGPATAATLDGPSGVAVDAAGNVYIADMNNGALRRVSASGVITTLAVANATGVAIDSSGALYMVGDDTVYRVDTTTGSVTPMAGSPTSTGLFQGDGGAATSASLHGAWHVASDSSSNLYITELGTFDVLTVQYDLGDARVRRVDAITKVITTVAGPLDPAGVGPVARAQLPDARALVVAQPFTLFAGGSTGTVLATHANRLDAVVGRYPQTVATGPPNLARFRDSSFGTVTGVAFDATANLIYLTESSTNRVDVVSVVDPADAKTWTIATLAGSLTGTAGFANGTAAAALFTNPTGLYLDNAARLLYVADTGNHVVRVIDLSTNMVSTIAGTPDQLGFFGDGGSARAAGLYRPSAITKCNGDLFIADTANHRVRRVDASGTITTVLGVGVAASAGEGSPARDFPVDSPLGLSCDDFGNLYVTSTTAVRQLAASDAHVVDGSGLVQTIYGSAPRDQFPASVTGCLTGVQAVGPTTVQVVDSCTGLLVQLDRVAKQ